MTRLPERLPAALSERIAGASSAIYSRFGREVDVAIGGIPFMLATNSEIPASVETIDVRKEQFDAEVDPGEQTLSGWWRRSQSSFHEGAGFLYEPNETNVAFNGFWDSEGVDVFTPGQVTLLRKMLNVGISGGTQAMSRMRTYAAGGVRTNLCTNPSAEVDATGWVAGGSVPPTITRTTANYFVGSASIKVVWGTGGTLPLAQFSFATTPGTTYTVSAYVWVPAGHPDITIMSPGKGFGSRTYGYSANFVRISHTLTADSASTAVQFWPMTPPTAGQECYIDALLFEQGSGLGPYFDGNSYNATWSGGAGLSTSVETTPAAAASLTAIGGGNLYKSTTDGDLTSNLTVLHDPAPTLVDGLISGNSFYSVASDGTLYQGLVSSPGTATTWPCGTAPSRMAWGKHRLWVIGGRKLWQPDLSLAGGTAQNPIFTHPNQGWNYTCMAEGPSAMYFGGHDGFASSIQAITFDSGGGIPSLSGAAVTAVLPDGELVQEIAVLAGQYVGIGTTRGFRVGVCNASDASITYGPLIVEPEGVTACTAVGTQGRFFLACFRTATGKAIAYRVDTGTELSEGVFAYAKDVDCNMVGSITSITAIGNQVCCTTNDGRPWYQHASTLVDTAWLQSCRIRFRTTEPKNYKYLSVETEPLVGSMSLDLIVEGDSTFPLGSITAQGEVYNDPFSIDLTPMKYVSVKASFAKAESGGPTFHSFLLRALPAVKPQRKHTLPLLCMDRERAKSGHIYGGEGYARDRLRALQLLEDAAETVIYQDFSAADGTGLQVTVDSVRFVQLSPGNPHRAEGAGGLIILELRTAEV